MTRAPNFLIVGACKSGTTSAYEFLRAHPQIFLPAHDKEPNRFSPMTGEFQMAEAAYHELFGQADQARAVGEASTSYLFDPESPLLIREELGRNVKIIVFLRNPVDMVHSLWSHQQREGFEDLEFEDALAAEVGRVSDPLFRNQCGGWWANFAYLRRAAYSEQVRRYLSTFGPQNVSVFIFEEFFRPGLPLYDELLSDLGVDLAHRPVERAHNVAGQTRNRWLQEAMRTPSVWKAPIRYVVPEAGRGWMKRSLRRWNRASAPKQSMAPETRAELDAHFQSEIVELENLLQRDLRRIWRSDTELGRPPAVPG